MPILNENEDPTLTISQPSNPVSPAKTSEQNELEKPKSVITSDPLEFVITKAPAIPKKGPFSHHLVKKDIPGDI
jgi:hypothetical protein